jgi:hypothetical protein
MFAFYSVVVTLMLILKAVVTWVLTRARKTGLSQWFSAFFTIATPFS